MHTRQRRPAAPPAIVYTPYGYTHVGDEHRSFTGFNGQPWDPVTGIYLLGNGYRGYDCRLMRFYSPDNLSPFAAGGINAYAYCNDNPINLVDPLGHWPSLLSWPFRLSWHSLPSWPKKTQTLAPITFEGGMQTLYKGREKISPTAFHKEVFKTGHAAFVTHGDHKRSSSKLLNQKGKKTSATSVARKEIAPRLAGLAAYQADPHKPVYLIACLAGQSGAAQKVANQLGRPVIAFEGVLYPFQGERLNSMDIKYVMKESKNIGSDQYIPKPLMFVSVIRSTS